MEITGAHKGRTTKVANVKGTTDKAAALASVMEHFGETEGSLFGWTVLEDDNGTIAVSLFTD